MIYNHGLNAACQVDGFEVDLDDWDNVNVWNFYGETLHDVIGIKRSTSGGALLADGAALAAAPRLQSLGAASGALVLDAGLDAALVAPAAPQVALVSPELTVSGEGGRCGYSFQESRMIGTCAEGLSCVNGKCQNLLAPTPAPAAEDRSGERYAAGEDPHVTLQEVKKPLSRDSELLPEPELVVVDEGAGQLNDPGYLARFNDILSRY